MPVDMNFAKKETVIELLEYLIRVSEMQVAKWQAGGDPIKACAGVIENTTTGRYSKIRPLPGVFRGFMDIFKKTNQLNRGLDLILDRSILCEGRQQGSNVQQYALLYGA